MLHHLLAAVDAVPSQGFDPWSLIPSAGVAGVFAAMFALGKIRSKAEIDDLRADRDKAQADRDKLQTSLIEQVIPALTRATQVMERLGRTQQRRGE